MSKIYPHLKGLENVEWYDDELPEKETNDVNPTGYVAAGNLDFKKRPRPRLVHPEKKMWVAYLLWLFGGWCCLHLLYLRRDRQAFIFFTTLGGYLGVGVMRDFFRIPTYVHDINNSEEYMKDLAEKMQKRKKPPFGLVRFVGQILVGNSWSFMVAAAVPLEEIYGIRLTFLLHLAPIGTALAVWVIGNIGREQGDFKWALIGAYVVLPLSLYHPPFSNSNAITSTLLFTFKGREWRRTPYPHRHICKRLMVLSTCWIIFCSLWASHLYFNATVTNKDGEEIKLRDAAANFLRSPMFLQFKRNAGKVYNDTFEFGWSTAWTNLVELLDPLGEIHALKVLGLQKGADQENITAAYRKLVKEWHPDKHRGDAKDEVVGRFLEVQAAYDKLSHIKKRRTRKKKDEEERKMEEEVREQQQQEQQQKQQQQQEQHKRTGASDNGERADDSWEEFDNAEKDEL